MNTAIYVPPGKLSLIREGRGDGSGFRVQARVLIQILYQGLDDNLFSDLVDY